MADLVVREAVVAEVAGLTGSAATAMTFPYRLLQIDTAAYRSPVAELAHEVIALQHGRAEAIAGRLRQLSQGVHLAAESMAATDRAIATRAEAATGAEIAARPGWYR